MKLNCAGDYELLKKWLEKHRDAHFIVYDKDSGLPVEAVYRNPIYEAYVSDPKEFLRKINELMKFKD